MRIALAVTTLIALTLAGLAYFFPWVKWTEVDVRSASISGPPESTLEDLRRVNRAATRNEPVPSGWSLAHQSTLNVVRVGGPGSGLAGRNWVATVRAPREDLVSATAFIDGAAVLTVTRESGGIVDRGEEAVATLDFQMPSHAISRRIEWVGEDGKIYHSSYGAPKFLVSLKRAANSVIDWLKP